MVELKTAIAIVLLCFVGHVCLGAGITCHKDGKYGGASVGYIFTFLVMLYLVKIVLCI